MKRKTFLALTFLTLLSLTACSQQSDKKVDHLECKAAPEKELVKQKEPHQYGGWYCPDNLYGFPAVDIQDWKEVPVVACEQQHRIVMNLRQRTFLDIAV